MTTRCSVIPLRVLQGPWNDSPPPDGLCVHSCACCGAPRRTVHVWDDRLGQETVLGRRCPRCRTSSHSIPRFHVCLQAEDASGKLVRGAGNALLCVLCLLGVGQKERSERCRDGRSSVRVRLGSIGRRIHSCVLLSAVKGARAFSFFCIVHFSPLSSGPAVTVTSVPFVFLLLRHATHLLKPSGHLAVHSSHFLSFLLLQQMPLTC